MRLLHYIKQHWRGNLSLVRAFWVNLVVLFFVLELLERFIFPPYIESEIAVTAAVIIYFIVVKLIIYPWQVVGVLRACDLRIKSGSGRVGATAVQLALVSSLAAILLTTIGTYQTLEVYKQKLIDDRIIPTAPLYSLELVKQNSLIYLRGPFQIGITNRVEELIGQYPEVKGIILDSEGGQIYEGRGLARLIRESGLQTITLNSCLSSCTTAFIAGTNRSLGKTARLGFHQYKTYSLIPSVNVENEQAKDMAIFIKQGVSPGFLKQIFSQPPEAMWWPDVDQLLEAGVVHQVGFALEP
jgi:hypothetical protein